MAVATIGWFGSDIWDAVTGTAGDAVNLAGDILSVVPGSTDLYGAIKDVVNGPLRDFAGTAVGKIVLTAMATTIYGPLAYAAGPQLAAAAFALPGIAAGGGTDFCGEDRPASFWTAWFQGFADRAQQAVAILGPMASKALGDEVKSAVDQLTNQAVGQLGTTWSIDAIKALSLPELAERLNVSQWATAYALNGLCPSLFPAPNPADYDANGNPLGVLARAGLFDVANAQFRAHVEAPLVTATSTVNSKGLATASGYVSSASHDFQAPIPTAATAVAMPTIAPASTASKIALGAAVIGALGVAVWAFKK